MTIDPNSPDWLDGYQTADAEQCHDYKEALAELLVSGPEELGSPYCQCAKCLTYRQARATAFELTGLAPTNA